MINIVAPPGCYGTYVARCLHHYISNDNNHVLNFDKHGSSHDYRLVDAKRTRNFHYQSFDPRPNFDAATTIVITGDSNHYLDYYNNQFYKQSQGNLIDYLSLNISKDAIQQQLMQNWNYTDEFNNRVPAWIIREYCSFWIIDAWHNGYNSQRYLSLPHAYSFCCQDLWTTDVWELMTQLTAAVDQKMYASEQIVRSNHAAFLNSQVHHNAQLRCEQFVYDIVNNVESDSPCVSIFDEAYVQYSLRKNGYEIQCHDLNQFPATSKQITKLIYETSNHSN